MGVGIFYLVYYLLLEVQFRLNGTMHAKYVLYILVACDVDNELSMEGMFYYILIMLYYHIICFMCNKIFEYYKNRSLVCIILGGIFITILGFTMIIQYIAYRNYIFKGLFYSTTTFYKNTNITNT